MSSYFASYNKNILIKFRLKRLFFALFVRVNKKDKFSPPLQQYFDNFIDSITGT